MTARLDASLSVDCFETKAQTDIAEMAASASAANERSAIVKLADLGEIDVEQLTQLVRNKDTP